MSCKHGNPVYKCGECFPPEAQSWVLNPWQPMAKPIDVKHLGKLGEEASELACAVSRCIIQGIDECEPVTKKLNRQWLQDEIADVVANVELVTEHFGLDVDAIRARVERKKLHLRGWHSMLEPKESSNGKRDGQD